MFSNLRMNGEKLTFDLRKPFKLIIDLTNRPDWLGWQDSNLRMAVPKTAALPLGDIPIMNFKSVQYK